MYWTRKKCLFTTAVVVAILVISASYTGASEPQVIGKITAIEVEGNRRIDQDTILKSMQLKVGDNLTREKLESDFASIDATGWFAEIGAKTAPYLGGLKLIIMVSEYPILKSLSIVGNQLISAESLMNGIQSKVNTLINANTIKADFEYIGKAYQEKGYWATVEPMLSQTGDLTIKVIEWAVAEVSVEGNQKTKTSVISRTLKTKVGDYINVNTINDDRRRIYMMGAFESVDARVEPIPGKPEYSVTYVVVERKTGSANLGVAFSSSEGFIGYVELEDQNFLGNLQRASVKAEFGGSKTNYQVGFFEPWLGSGSTSLGFNLYSRVNERKMDRPTVETEEEQDPDHINYSQRRTGGDITVGRTMSVNTRAFLKLKVENTLNTASVPEDQEHVPDSGRTRSLTLSAVSDLRNDLWNPSSGHRLFGSVEYAGGLLGGDHSFAKLESTASKYYEVREGHILAAQLSTGLGFSAHPNGLPDQEKFRIGGAESVRGYKHGEFKGDRMAVVNAEYRFKIASALQGVLFCDVGQAWESNGEFQFENTKVGYGAGVRIMVPAIGMIRLDYGRGQNGGQMYFSFGQSF